MTHSFRPLQPRVKDCRSCKAPIVFVKIAATGKAMPLDAAPVANGNVVLIDAHTAKVLSPEEAAVETGQRYRSHFMVCPDAKGWRRKRSIPEPAGTTG